MYNYNSPVIQSMVNTQQDMYNPFTPDPPVPNNLFQQQYNPNQDYFNAGQQLNMTTEYRPIYNNPYGPPQLNMYYQQPRQPWQLMQPNMNQAQYANQQSPFISTAGPGYGPTGWSQYNTPSYQQSYVIPGFNPTGVDKMYSAELQKKLDNLNDKYQRLNTEKAIERRQQYSGFGYNYYGMMNQNYIDPILNSEYNREKAKIEAEAKELAMDFNLKISKAVHYYLGDVDPDDEEKQEHIKQAYSNTVVNIPKTDMDNYYKCRSLERGIDITEAAKASAAAADRKVSEYYHKIVKPDATIDEWLNSAGLILWEASVEEMNKKAYNQKYSYDKLKNDLQRNIDLRDGFYPSYRDLDPDKPFRELGLLGNGIPGVNYDSGTISLNRDEWLANRKQIEHNREQMDYEAQRRAFIDSIYNPSVV